MGTMTKAEKFILNVLREGTIKWPERNECYRRHGRLVNEGARKNGKIKWKWYWHCAKCSKESRERGDFEVDHIIEVGPFRGDWTDYIRRLYCSADSLQLLCITCHKIKTSGFNSSLRYQRKNKSEYDDLL